jgi:hypothetical protein
VCESETDDEIEECIAEVYTTKKNYIFFWGEAEKLTFWIF